MKTTIETKINEVRAELLKARAQLQDAQSHVAELQNLVARLTGASIALNDLIQSLPTELPSNTP